MSKLKNPDKSANQPNSPEDKEKKVSSTVMYQIRETRMGFWVALGIAATSVMLHEPLFHRDVKVGWNNYVTTPLENWRKEREQEALKEKMGELKSALDKDKEAVAKINKSRKLEIDNRKKQAEAWKRQLLENDNYLDEKIVPRQDIFFPIEYFSQGVEEKEMKTAKEVFDIVDGEIKIADLEIPQHDDLQKIVNAFMPAGSYERTKTSAIASLAQNLSANSQNCVARMRLMIMAVATKYPKYVHGLFIQKFGDHDRAILEVNGQRYILEGNVPTFPDTLTSKYKNEVIPFDVYLGMYAGIDRKKMEDKIEKHGPEVGGKGEEYARVTDDLVDNFVKSKGLGNIGSADGWFAPEAGGSISSIGGQPAGSSSARVAFSSGATGGGNLMSVNEKYSPTELIVEEEELTAKLAEEIFKPESLTGKFSIEFPHLKKVTPEGMKVFVQKVRSKSVNFKVLTGMDLESAKELAKMKGPLSFENVVDLPVPMATGLNEFQGRLSFYNIKIVSAEAAAALVGQVYGLSDFFDINDLLPEGADSNYAIPVNNGKINAKPAINHGELYFEGLAGLSLSAANSLGNYRGSITLSKSRIGEQSMTGFKNNRSLTINAPQNPEQIKGLASRKWTLTLNSITDAEEYAEDIGKLGADVLYLNLNEKLLTPDQVKKIAQFKDDLYMGSGGFALPKNLLLILLEEFKGKRLSLHGLKNIDLDIAMKIANFQGDELNLGGLDEVDEQVAEQFAKSTKKIDFRPRKATLKVLEILSKANNPGIKFEAISDITVEMVPYLIKDGLITVDSLKNREAAQAIAKQAKTIKIPYGFVPKDIWIEDLVAGNTEVYIGIDSDLKNLELLNKHTGPLYLTGQLILTPALAEKIVELQTSELTLHMLTKMTPEVAKILLKFKGKLNLPNFAIRDMEVAKILHERVDRTKVFAPHQVRIEEIDKPWVEDNGPQPSIGLDGKGNLD